METIGYPKDLSESEVQAELYHYLKKEDIDIRLEVSASNGKADPGRNRLDAVVFRDGQAVCIIECKSALIHELSSQYKRRLDAQLKKYKNMFGLPVIVCGNSQMDIGRTIAQVKQLI